MAIEFSCSFCTATHLNGKREEKEGKGDGEEEEEPLLAKEQAKETFFSSTFSLSLSPALRCLECQACHHRHCHHQGSFFHPPTTAPCPCPSPSSSTYSSLLTSYSCLHKEISSRSVNNDDDNNNNTNNNTNNSSVSNSNSNSNYCIKYKENGNGGGNKNHRRSPRSGCGGQIARDRVKNDHKYKRIYDPAIIQPIIWTVKHLLNFILFLLLSQCQLSYFPYRMSTNDHCGRSGQCDHCDHCSTLCYTGNDLSNDIANGHFCQLKEEKNDSSSIKYLAFTSATTAAATTTATATSNSSSNRSNSQCPCPSGGVQHSPPPVHSGGQVSTSHYKQSNWPMNSIVDFSSLTFIPLALLLLSVAAILASLLASLLASFLASLCLIPPPTTGTIALADADDANKGRQVASSPSDINKIGFIATASKCNLFIALLLTVLLPASSLFIILIAIAIAIVIVIVIVIAIVLLSAITLLLMLTSLVSLSRLMNGSRSIQSRSTPLTLRPHLGKSMDPLPPLWLLLSLLTETSCKRSASVTLTGPKAGHRTGGQLIAVASVILIVFSSSVGGELTPPSKAIMDPRVITYPGDLNLALFVDGHESMNPSSRSGKAAEEDIRPLPVPFGPQGSQGTSMPLECSSKINSDGVLKAMSAIWAAHQVNIRRSRSKDSEAIKIGVSVFDACSSPIVIQRQSVRMISSSLFASPSSASLSNGKLCQGSSGKAVQPTIFGALVDTDTESTSGPALSLLDSFSIPVITTSHIYQDILTGNDSKSGRHTNRKLPLSQHQGSQLSYYPSLPRLSSKSSVFSVAPSLQFMARGVISLLNRLSWSTATLVISDQIPSYYTDVFEEIASKVHFNVISSSTSSNNRMRTVPISRRSDSSHFDTRNSINSGNSSRKRSSPLHDFSYPEPVKNTLLFLSSKESLQLLTSLRTNLPLPDADKFNWILVTDSDISDKVKQLFSHTSTSNSSNSSQCLSKSMLLLMPNTNVPTREFNRYFEHEISTFGSSSVHPLVAKFSKQYLEATPSDGEASKPVPGASASAAAGNLLANSTLNGKKKKKLLITSSEGLSLTIKSVWTLALALKRVESDECTQNSLTKAACIERLNSKGLRDLVTLAIRNMANESLQGLGVSAMENENLTFNELNILKTNKFSLKVITSSCKIFDAGFYSEETGLRANEVIFSTLKIDSSSKSASEQPFVTTNHQDLRQHSPSLLNSDSTAGSGSFGFGNRVKNSSSAKAHIVSGSRLLMTTPSLTGSTSKPPSVTPAPGHRNSYTPSDKITVTTGTGGLSFVSGSGGGHFDGGITDTTANSNGNSNGNISDTDEDNSEDENEDSGGVKNSLDEEEDNLTRTLPGDTNDSFATAAAVNATSDKKRKRNSVTDSRGNSTRNGKGATNAHDEEGHYHHTSFSSSPSLASRHRDTTNSDNGNSGNRASGITSTSGSLPSLTDHSVAMFAKLPPIQPHNGNGNGNGNTSSGRQGRRGNANSASTNAASAGNMAPGVSGKNSVLTRQTGNFATGSGGGASGPVSISSASTSLTSWLGRGWSLAILVGSIIGSLVTLYTFTFLLMKSCEGALGHNYRQSLIAINLLSIMLLFLGSMLYIFEPSPVLCTARRSAHNLSLCLLFGSLLIKSMYLRAHKTIGLGGQVNQVNQFLTLVFIIAVQVSIESHYWKQLADWSSSPVASANLITYSIHTLCSPGPKDYLSNQSYLLIVFILLLLFSWVSRNEPLTSNEGSNLFTSTALISPVYITGIVLCEYFVPLSSAEDMGSSMAYLTSSRDIINGITMIVIGYITLCTIFVPILYSVHTYGTLIGSANGGIGATYTDSSLSTAFTMFRTGMNGGKSGHPHQHPHHHHHHSAMTSEHNALHHSPPDHRPILDNLSTSSATSSANHEYHVNSSPSRLLNAARAHAKHNKKTANGHSKSFAGQLSHHLFPHKAANNSHGHSHDDGAIHFSPCTNSYSYACNSPNCNFKLQPRQPLPGPNGPSPRLMHGRSHLGLHLIPTSSAHGAGAAITSNPNGSGGGNGNGNGGGNNGGNSRFPPGLFRNEIPTFNRFISSSNKTRGVERDRGDHGTLITGVTYNRMNPLFETNGANGPPGSGPAYRSAYP